MSDLQFQLLISCSILVGRPSFAVASRRQTPVQRRRRITGIRLETNPKTVFHHNLVSSFLAGSWTLRWNKCREESVADVSEAVRVLVCIADLYALTLVKTLFHSERTLALRTQWKQNMNRPCRFTDTTNTTCNIAEQN